MKPIIHLKNQTVKRWELLLPVPTAGISTGCWYPCCPSGNGPQPPPADCFIALFPWERDRPGHLSVTLNCQQKRCRLGHCTLFLGGFCYLHKRHTPILHNMWSCWKVAGMWIKQSVNHHCAFCGLQRLVHGFPLLPVSVCFEKSKGFSQRVHPANCTYRLLCTPGPHKEK